MIDTDDRSVERAVRPPPMPGGNPCRAERTVEGQGGYATVEGKSEDQHRAGGVSGEGAVGRTVYGQPAYAGTVNTKYNGNYATAGARNP